MTLFLDCPFLYERLCVISGPTYVDDYFSSDAKYSHEKNSLYTLGSIQRIQNQLNMLQLDRCEKIGHFERRINTRLVEYIAADKNRSNDNEVFIFISSQNSVTMSDYSRKFQVRTEKYNDKEISLLRFGDKSEDDLEIEVVSSKLTENVAAGEGNICFSLWSLIVNIDPALVDKLEIGGEAKEEYASNILIKMQWEYGNDIFKKVNIFCCNANEKCCEDGCNESRCSYWKELIKSYFEVLFMNECKMEFAIWKSMRDSFLNVFFSQIADVCQAVAYQKFQERLQTGYKIEVNVETTKLNTGGEDREYKISTEKKAYVDIIENLSRDYPSGLLTKAMEYRITKVRLKPSKVYNDILEACRKLKCTEGNLYINTQKARNDE